MGLAAVSRPDEKPRKPARLLLIDDDPGLCDLVSQYLERERLAVVVAGDGETGLREALKELYDLIILDVMLPDTRGFDVLRELRLHVRTPVLMLTARGDEFDRVLGLELGADDYLPKPFSSRELLARVVAILRRSGWESEERSAPRPMPLRSGDLELDLASRSASQSGEQLHLTSAEFDLLHALLESPGQVLPRETLAERVLGRKFSPFDRSIDLHVSNLRRKLGPPTNGTERIRSVRGIGYMYAWPL